jgi:hypothetical protein
LFNSFYLEEIREIEKDEIGNGEEKKGKNNDFVYVIFSTEFT